MPIYDYKCKSCEEVWELNHSINDDATSLNLVCPNCESADIFKYFGNMRTLPVHFKGTGFSINDSALDKLGMPKNIQNSEATKDRLKRL